MARPKKAKVQRAELIKRVAADCGYYEYEVDDVLSGLSRVLLSTLANGESVLIEGIGSLEVNAPVAKQYYDTRVGAMQNTLSKPKLIIRPSLTLKKLLLTNEYLEAKTAIKKLPVTPE
jgi:nucleoid DNA-binding protein